MKDLKVKQAFAFSALVGVVLIVSNTLCDTANRLEVKKGYDIGTVDQTDEIEIGYAMPSAASIPHGVDYRDIGKSYAIDNNYD